MENDNGFFILCKLTIVVRQKYDILYKILKTDSRRLIGICLFYTLIISCTGRCDTMQIIALILNFILM